MHAFVPEKYELDPASVFTVETVQFCKYTGGASSKEPACQRRRRKRRGFGPQVWKIPGAGNGTHSCILAWRIPRTEEPEKLQSTGSQRVRHDLGHVPTSIYHEIYRKTVTGRYFWYLWTQKQEDSI